METSYSLSQLKHYHSEATQFFASQLSLIRKVIPHITDDKLSKAVILLVSNEQTGAALLQLSIQTDMFTAESMMLARSFIEKAINFCYVSICDEEEYRAFLLHPVYKYYHLTGMPNLMESWNFEEEEVQLRKKKQETLKQNPIVQEALDVFSETNPRLNWTKKTLNQRITAIEEWGKLLDVFFTLAKLQYYSDTSEALHGSLYGCTYGTGVFDPEFDHTNNEGLDKKLYKDSACILLHLGMLIHECLTLISYSNKIEDLWDHSYKNRNMALNLLFHVLEKKPEHLRKI